MEKIKLLYQLGQLNEARVLVEERLNAYEYISLEELQFDFKVLMRCYFESLDFESHKKLLFENIFHVRTQFELDWSQFPAYYYWQSLYFLNIQQQNASLQTNEKAIQLALQGNDFKVLAQTLILKTKLLMSQKWNSEQGLFIQKTLEQIRVLVEKVNDSELSISYALLLSDFEVHKGNFGQALELVWKAYEEAKNTSESNFYFASTLAKIGHITLQASEFEKAYVLFLAAEKMINIESMGRLFKIIQNLKADCDKKGQLSRSQVVVDLKDRVLVLQDQSKIFFKNNNLPLEIIKLFVQNPSQIFSKKDLIEKIWQEGYDSEKHDNILYVNINRVKKMIADTPGGQSFFLKNKFGYQLNPQFPIKLRGVHNEGY